MEEKTKTVKPKNEKKKNIIITLLAIGLVLALSWGVYGFIDSGKKTDEISELNAENSQLASEPATNQTDEPEKQEASSNATKPAAPVAVAPPQNSAPVSGPVIVFEPGGLFSDTTRQELTKKLIAPYVAYSQDTGTNPVSIHITTPDTSPGEWSVFIINGTDNYSSFLFGNDGLATQNWWFPECLDGVCNFTNQFKATYPEVVSASKV